MPFTLSHIGFVLPLRKRLGAALFLGLAVGSTVPDVPYFVRAFHLSPFAHSFPGGLLFGLPIGLAISFIILASFDRLASAMPSPHREFLGSWESPPRNYKSILALCLGLVLGAWAHSFVDSFTHESGAAVARLPFLQQTIFSVGGEPIHGFRLLQYLGSIGGMLALVLVYVSSLLQFCRDQGLTLWQDRPRWLVLLALAIGAGLLATFLHRARLPNSLNLLAYRAFIFQFLITWLPLMFGSFVAFAFLRRKA